METEDSNTTSKKKILLIDDDEPIIVMTEGMLNDDYEVTVVNSGFKAYKLISSGYSPNLVLLDLFMPDMGGWNTLLKIRNLCEKNKTLIAIYTSSEDTEGLAKAKEFGAVEYINKPISRKKLLDIVAKLLK
jgi:putative two-component system response regulator